jgi:hypothetical protein
MGREPSTSSSENVGRGWDPPLVVITIATPCSSVTHTGADGPGVSLAATP